MTLRDFLSKQFIDVIEWVEPEDGILAFRYPMQDREIQNGGKLTVLDSQLATRIQTDQHWGTQTPITIRDKDFGAVRLRGFGIYSYHLADPKAFYQHVSGTRDLYRVEDLEGQLRNSIIGQLTDTFAGSNIPFLDMAANQAALSEKISGQVKPLFANLGLALDSFVVENLSLPEELQKILDQRIGMNMVGDMGRYTQYQAAQSIPIAAANEGGGVASAGVGLGAGLALGQTMADALRPQGQGAQAQGTPGPATPAPPSAAAAGEAKFCLNCGKSIPKISKFCPQCGLAQP